jgi:MFS family permease
MALKLFIVGQILDSYGRRNVLLIIVAADTPTYLPFINRQDFIQGLSLWIPASVIWAFYEATYSSLEADLVPKERRGRVFAAFSVAWSAFSIPASLVGGVIYEKIDPRISFILAAVVVVVCFITTAKFIHLPKKKQPRLPHDCIEETSP